MPDPISLTLTTATGLDSYGSLNLLTGVGSFFSSSSTELLVAQAVAGEVTRAGLQFQFPNLQFSSDGDVLDPPTIATATLNFTITSPLGTSFVLQVVATTDARSSLYSLSNPPGVVETISILGTSGLGPDPLTYTIASGFSGLVSLPLSVAKLQSALNRPRSTGGYGWGGRISIVLKSDELVGSGNITVASDEHLTLDPPSLALTYIPFHTGWMVDRGDQPGRATHSMRSGVPAPSYELMEDGWADGIWVTESEWDPDDPFEFDEYVHPTGQGTREDEVPI